MTHVYRIEAECPRNIVQRMRRSRSLENPSSEKWISGLSPLDRANQMQFTEKRAFLGLCGNHGR
jgi:hypothetical protein